MLDNRPKITVLVPTFNRSNFLAECLDSLLSQTLPPVQVIVVNDGSTDGTLKVLQPYMKKIDYLETSQEGKAAALNCGMEKAVGDYLWVFDDDDVAFKDALERFAAPFEKNPALGFSYSTFYLTASQWFGHKIGSVMSESKVPDLNSRGFMIPLLEGNFLGGAALFARTHCYKEVGGFLPPLFRSQDYDMAIKIARRYQGIRLSGGPTFHYRQHEGMRGNIQDRFLIRFRPRKWFEYDQMIFRWVYKDFLLTEYLPPQLEARGHERQALLQRLAIMAYKMLIPESISDLTDLSKVQDNAPFSTEEKAIIYFMATAQYYNVSHALEQREFIEELHRLSSPSELIVRLKNEMVLSILKWRGEKLSPRRWIESKRRLSYLK